MLDLEKLREFRKCPSGDAEAWRARYAPFVARELRHRELTTPKVSVVVVAYHSAARVLGCLERLRTQQGFGRDDLEVVLVDNGGLESVHAELPRFVDVEVRMKHNVGLCPARNLGAAIAKADVLSFIDDDGLIELNYYQNALVHLTDPEVYAIRTRILYNEHRYFTALAAHYDRGDAVRDDCLVTEGSSVLRRGPYFAIGGFADSLSPFEGLDLSFRLKSYFPNARILYAPNMVMHHDYCDGFKKLFRKSLGYRSIFDLAEGTDPEVEKFLRAYVKGRPPPPRRPLDETLARHGLGLVMSSLKLYSRLKGRKSSYIRADSEV